jgi:hypothetical protein
MNVVCPVTQKAVALYSVETLVTTSALCGDVTGILTAVNTSESVFLYAKAVFFSETRATTYKTRRCHSPEYHTLNIHGRTYLRYHN